MKIFKEHPHEFNISKAFMRVEQTPKKIVYFELLYKQGTLSSFKKHKNTVSKALIVTQHGEKSPTVIKLESLPEGNNQLKMVICPEKREIALYIKSGDKEYADYFYHKHCKNGRLWALFELRDGFYEVLFDCDKSKICYGYYKISCNEPNPFDLISIGLNPTFKFDN